MGQSLAEIEWRRAARRKFISRARRMRTYEKQDEMARIIAQCIEQFGKKPDNTQLAEIFGVTTRTITKWKNVLRERLSVAQCPICGGSGIKVKL